MRRDVECLECFECHFSFWITDNVYDTTRIICDFDVTNQKKNVQH